MNIINTANFVIFEHRGWTPDLVKEAIVNFNYTKQYY